MVRDSTQIDVFFFLFLLFFLTFTEGKVLIFIVTSHPSGSVYSVSLSAQATETQTEIEMEREEKRREERREL